MMRKKVLKIKQSGQETASGVSAVNSVNQRKSTLKFYALNKEIVYLNGTSKVSVTRNKQYLSEVFKTPLVVPFLVKMQEKS